MPKGDYETPTGFITSSPVSIALRRLAGHPNIASDATPFPADLLKDAADEIDALRDALFWCGGSSDFSPGGVAHEGWQRIVVPLMAR